MPVSHLYVFFGEISICLGLLPIYSIGLLSVLFCFLILSVMSCLYILEINPLSVASFAIIFSHSEGCLFFLFMVFFFFFFNFLIGA